MHPASNPQRREEVQTGLAEVYGDISSQLEVARIITSHLNKKGDIRQIALRTLELSGVTSVLDLGCGSGFFTEGLNGLVHPRASVTGIDVHPSYEGHFLKTCGHTGLQGVFDGNGIDTIKTYTTRSYDLALSSYSLYFFPGHIPRIARLIKPGGHLVAITHAVPHMIELTSYIKKILEEEGIDYHHELPYESLIRNFSDENGTELLAPWFRKVKKYRCKSTLEFQDGEINSLLKYLKYKEAFFLPENDFNHEDMINVIAGRIEQEMKRTGRFSITKDDFIFVCTGPVPQPWN
jgi:SAM-dependent methyltransferase